MKKNKFLLFALLPLTCFGIIETFLLPSFTAYSEETKDSKENLDCYKKYEEYKEAEAYCRALANTKVATPQKIWKNLTAIDGNNPELIWENNKVNSHVSVVTWTKHDGYKEDEETNAKIDIWVTVVPELHKFCHNYYQKDPEGKDPEGIPHRLNQVLGLPPEEKKVLGLPPEQEEQHEKDKGNKKEKNRKLVEIWVEPKDLFRPTPDPEIDDHQAELDFPQPYSLALVFYEYKLWFLNQLMTNRNPWTKLGYTYDWGDKRDWHWRKSDPERPIPANAGLSEFIIRKGAPIKISSINEAEDYCSKEHTPSS